MLQSVAAQSASGSAAPALDPVTQAVIVIFHTPGAALGMASALLLFAAFLIVYSNHTEYKPLILELRDRWNLLAGTRQRNARKTFFRDFANIDVRFSGVSNTAQAPAALVLGWANYRSLLVENDGEFSTTTRAAEAFDRLDGPARSLEWWANIMVSLGLVITFLGIVAALTEATIGIAGAAGNSAAMEKALMGLLTIAATKFWTSIAGVFASIVLRVIARGRRKRIESMEANVFEGLDACVQFMPPEKVLVDQLKSLKRMELALSAMAGLAPSEPAVPEKPADEKPADEKLAVAKPVRPAPPKYDPAKSEAAKFEPAKPGSGKTPL